MLELGYHGIHCHPYSRGGNFVSMHNMIKGEHLVGKNEGTQNGSQRDPTRKRPLKASGRERPAFLTKTNKQTNKNISIRAQVITVTFNLLNHKNI